MRKYWIQNLLLLVLLLANLMLLAKTAKNNDLKGRLMLPISFAAIMCVCSIKVDVPKIFHVQLLALAPSLLAVLDLPLNGTLFST